MALKKLCAKCHEVIDQGNTYCDKCNSKVNSINSKVYNESSRNKESQSFYNNKQWKKLTHVIKQKDNGLCLNCLNDNKIKYKDVIHHIIPLTDDKSKALDINNLISLCHTCHNRTHGMYDKNIKLKEEEQLRLNNILNKFRG